MSGNTNIISTMVDFIRYEMREYCKKYYPDSDFICYYGGISIESIELWKQEINFSATTAKRRGIDTITIFLHTDGGLANAVEKIVEITRNFYDKVYFIIPNYAMSAGTIWTMSGDKIIMNYASSLGPIDPQVPNKDGRWVPALGYLDKVNELIDKSRNNVITQAELMMLNQLDLAELRHYEQAAELSVDLLKKWLVTYKFKNWTHHRTTNKGNLVTEEEKNKRAQDIAYQLNDNSKWHSHGRFIGIQTLVNELRLEIDDFSENIMMCKDTDNLHKLVIDTMNKFQYEIFVLAAHPANLDAITG